MEAFVAVGLIVLVAAITPGPNNFIVLSAAMKGRSSQVVQAILFIILGTLVLLLMVWAGAGELFALHPLLRPALTVAGGGYLCWMGLRLIRAAGTGNDPQAQTSALPSGPGIALFQLMNPKAWVLVVTAFAALPGELGPLEALIGLLLIFPVITGSCLTLWALAGQLLSSVIGAGQGAVWFDRAMGGLLSLSALSLMMSAMVAL